METYGKAMEYAETSANSAGTAVDKYENTYLKSVAAAQEKFSAQFEQLSATIWNSDLLKGTINTGTGALGALTFIIDKLGSIPTLAASVSGALAFKNIGRTNSRPLFKISIIEYALLT